MRESVRVCVCVCVLGVTCCLTLCFFFSVNTSILTSDMRLHCFYILPRGKIDEFERCHSSPPLFYSLLFAPLLFSSHLFSSLLCSSLLSWILTCASLVSQMCSATCSGKVQESSFPGCMSAGVTGCCSLRCISRTPCTQLNLWACLFPYVWRSVVAQKKKSSIAKSSVSIVNYRLHVMLCSLLPTFSPSPTQTPFHTDSSLWHLFIDLNSL